MKRMKCFWIVLMPLFCLGAKCPSANNPIGQVLEEDGGLPSRSEAGVAGGNSYRWTQVAGAVNLPPRLEGMALAFNQLLWVMGGLDVSGANSNDVWSSGDGQTWTMATASAGWSKRGMASGAVFSGRMWVIDGARAGDVWSSTDGAQWQEMTVTSPFPPRYSHGVLVFDNKLWILGGYGQGGTEIGDIWSSTDGARWSQVVPMAPWGQRDQFASAVFDDKMWVIGGYVYGANVSSEVWSSADGIEWTKEPAPPFVARQAHRAAVFDNKLWMMGGSAYGGEKLNDVWSTSDGKIWTQMSPDQVPWSPRSGFSLAVLDRLYLIGPRTGDVWTLEVVATP